MIRELTACLVCAGDDLAAMLDLGAIPLVNELVKDAETARGLPRYPLRVARCRGCGHVQLGHSVSPEALFSEYVYLTGSAESVRTHAVRLAELAGACGAGEGLVVELASNDGTVLEAFAARGHRVLGIEPAGNVAELAEARGIPTLARFFTEALAGEVRASHGEAAVVLARNVLAHVPAQRGFVRGIARLLAPDGVAYIEVPYLGDLLAHTEFDTIYHEHLSYFSVGVLDRLFAEGGLALVDARRIALHGGSLLLEARRADGRPHRAAGLDAFIADEGTRLGEAAISAFVERVRVLRDAIAAYVRSLATQGTVAGYGASAKGAVLMNVCGLGAAELAYLVDKNPRKQGLRAPGTGLAIHPVERLRAGDAAFLLLLAWNFADEIMRQQAAFAAGGGRFVVPIPEPQLVTTADLDRPAFAHLRSVGVASA